MRAASGRGAADSWRAQRPAVSRNNGPSGARLWLEAPARRGGAGRRVVRARVGRARKSTRINSIIAKREIIPTTWCDQWICQHDLCPPACLLGRSEAYPFPFRILWACTRDCFSLTLFVSRKLGDEIGRRTTCTICSPLKSDWPLASSLGQIRAPK